MQQSKQKLDQISIFMAYIMNELIYESAQQSELDNKLYIYERHLENQLFKLLIQMNQSEQFSNTGGKRSNKQKPFYCKCGKRYGSAAAVHTHINTKHIGEQKEYKKAMNNPKLDKKKASAQDARMNPTFGQKKATGQREIRMKNIAVDKLEIKVISTADTAFENIYNIMQKYQVKDQEFLLGENQIDSCQELDYDKDEEDIGKQSLHKTKRAKQIHQLVKDLQQFHQIMEVRTLVSQAAEFFSFKLTKFKLNMVNQLIKYFNIDYGSKIQLQLQIIAAKKRITREDELWERLSSVENQLWNGKVQIIMELQKYYSEWISLIPNQNQ